MIRQHCQLRRPVPIVHRGQIKDWLEFAMTRAGAPLRSHQSPARWGWGATVRRDRSQRWWLHDFAWGTADPVMEHAMRQLTADGLQASAEEGGVSLGITTIQYDVPPDFSLPLWVRPLTPIRVLESVPVGRRKALLHIDAAWEAGLNRTMAFRFGRPFALTVTVDPVVTFDRRIVAAHSFSVRATGQLVGLPGVVTPFLLTGPADDLATAWASGIGASTGMGFGWIADAESLLADAAGGDFDL